MEKFILTKQNSETFYEFISAVPCLNRIFANDTGKRSSYVKHFFVTTEFCWMILLLENMFKFNDKNIEFIAEPFQS